jgi:hypothetical protein
MHTRNEETRGEGAAEPVHGSTRRFRGLGWLFGVLAGLSLSLPGCLGALGGVGGLGAPEWKEEVALHDGRILLVNRSVQLVSGESFHSMEGARRLTFADPTTGQPVIWESPGQTGLRLRPMLLDIEGGRLFLVTMAQSGPDYETFGCPTPPYIVFRHEGGTWVRVPVADLPRSLTKMNLLPNSPREGDRSPGSTVVGADAAARFYRTHFFGDDYALYGTVDHRLRNPLGLGCSRDAIEKLFGVEKYSEWLKTGNWLDKTEAEALKLLRRKDEGAKP